MWWFDQLNVWRATYRLCEVKCWFDQLSNDEAHRTRLFSLSPSLSFVRLFEWIQFDTQVRLESIQTSSFYIDLSVYIDDRADERKRKWRMLICLIWYVAYQRKRSSNCSNKIKRFQSVRHDQTKEKKNEWRRVSACASLSLSPSSFSLLPLALLLSIKFETKRKESWRQCKREKTTTSKIITCPYQDEI